MTSYVGPLIIVSGPSGSGKSTLISDLLLDQPAPLRLSVSATTRKPRPGEEEGKHYHFWDRTRFEPSLAAGDFLECAEVYGNYYGTLNSEVTPFRAQGICVLLDIDTQGAEQVWRLCPDAVGVFIRTSSLAEYERRLRERGTESEVDIAKRVAGARSELAHADRYQYHIINDDLPDARAKFRAVVEREVQRSKNANAG